MKTYDNIYSQIWDFQNLLKSYYQARKNKSCKSYAIKVEWDFEKLLFQLKRELEEGTYQPLPYYSFITYDPKERLIFVAPFRDRIVHHALHNVIEPLFDKGFAFDSYACRKQKGVHKAVLRVKSFMRSFNNKPFFVLKCDIKKYFNSLDRDDLKNLINRKIKDQKAINLINKIIYSLPGDEGMPIGNLTSQLFANVYLNELDQFVKNTLKVKYYCRYVDDFVLLASDKEQLKLWRLKINDFLNINLKLSLHDDRQEIFPSKIGVDFLGYHIFEDHILVRQSTVRRCFRRLKNHKMNLNSYYSYLGHFALADSFGLIRKLKEKYAYRYAGVSSNAPVCSLALPHSQ